MTATCMQTVLHHLHDCVWCAQVCHARAYTTDQQMELLISVAAMMADEPFKLLIVDSITANLRVDFSGRGELAERQQKLGQMMSKLKKVT